jgi:Kelch motif/Galactose oxidase, central domain
LTQGRIKGAALLAVLAALLIAPGSAGAVNQVSFSQVGNLTTQRESPGAALLPDGRVLIVAGYDDSPSPTYLKTAEIFDPKTNSFSPVSATISEGVYWPQVASLPDGRVLVAGGYNGTDDIATAQVFNPGTGSFSPVGSLLTARDSAATAPLPNGRVLIAGGFGDGNVLMSSEIFNPQTNTFSPGPPLPAAKYGAPGVVISNGRILIPGGYSDDYLSSVFAFDPASNAFTGAASLPFAAYAPAGASLPQGRALVAGGANEASGSRDEISTATIFDSATNSYSLIGGLVHKREEAAAVELKDGRALVAAGWADGHALDTAEVLSVPSNAFKAKLNGRKVKFTVTTEGVAQATDISTKVATTAKKKKGPKLVKTTSKHGGPGKITVKIKLTKQGNAKLREKGKLKVRVVYTPDQGLSATKKLKLSAGK